MSYLLLFDQLVWVKYVAALVADQSDHVVDAVLSSFGDLSEVAVVALPVSIDGMLFLVDLVH
jgi:hypothetical protein